MEFQGVTSLIGLWNLEQRHIRREAPGDAVGGDRTHALKIGDGPDEFGTHPGNQLAVLVVKRVSNTIIRHDPIVDKLTGTVNREGATIGHTKTLRHLLLIQEIIFSDRLDEWFTLIRTCFSLVLYSDVAEFYVWMIKNVE
jgi:hypothetical protein